jgi:hypothetical protein
MRGTFSMLDIDFMRLSLSLPRKDLREPEGALQIPPLRFASVGMTRGEGWLWLELLAGWGETAGFLLVL